MKMNKNRLFSFIVSLSMIFVLITGLVGVNADSNVAKIGDVNYASLNEAIINATDGSEIVLVSDSLDEAISFGTECNNKTLTLDMNNNMIDCSEVDFQVVVIIRATNLNLTIKNGTINSTSNKQTGIYAAKGANNLNLTLDNVNIDTIDQGFGVQGLNTEQNVTMTNCNIDGGVLGIYYPPISGTLTINNSVIEGEQGIVHKGGTIIINGGNTKIIGTGSRTTKDKPYDGSPVAGTNVFPATGDAIYVEGGYANRDIVLFINNGTFTSTNGEGVEMKFADYGNPASTIVRKIEVKGGTFSTPVDDSYLAAGYKNFEEDSQYVIRKYTQSIVIPTNLKIEKDATASIKATVTPSDTSEAVTYTSSDETVVTVDTNGKVTAIGAGSATITVTSGEQSQTCNVTVYELPADVVISTPNTVTPEVVVNDDIKEVVEDTVKEIIESDSTNAVSKQTKEELDQAIADKKVITVVPEVTKLDETTVGEDVISKIEAQLGTTGEIAQYFDISLSLNVDGKSIGKINELTGKVSFTVEIDESLIQEGRTFYMIALHEDGSVEKISGTLVGNKFTFETNKFSTYALGYQEAAKAKTNTNQGKNTSPVKTDDEAPVLMYLVTSFFSLICSCIIYRNIEE